MSEDLTTTLIFTGAGLVGKGLEARLLEIGIKPIVKDDHASAIIGGFSAGIPNQVRIFIRKDQLVTAQEVIDQYLKEVS